MPTIAMMSDNYIFEQISLIHSPFRQASTVTRMNFSLQVNTKDKLTSVIKQESFPLKLFSEQEPSLSGKKRCLKHRQMRRHICCDCSFTQQPHACAVFIQFCHGSCNRWCQNIFGDSGNPGNKNLLTYFSRFEFQERGTLHLHTLIWVKDITLIRADLLQASIPWNNVNDAFLVADTEDGPFLSATLSQSKCLCAEPGRGPAAGIPVHGGRRMPKSARLHHNSFGLATVPH